jgi:hypothetical protein
LWDTILCVIVLCLPLGRERSSLPRHVVLVFMCFTAVEFPPGACA